MTASVLGGVAMPHAPQFFTLPETEDKAMVERIRSLAEDNGAKLARLEPDAWIVIANDHVNQFFLHCTPSFTFHVGGEARGGFAGREFHYEVASQVSYDLVRHLQREGFDPAFTSTARIDYAFGIPLTFLGVRGPVIPLYVNAYVPPQPPIERCYALGQAIARGLAASGTRAVVVASGGMSHFPGTERYAEPDAAFDRELLAKLETGNLRALLALDERCLDQRGNVELRSWAIAAGMLGERRPDVVALEESWHHTYGTLAWYTPPQDDERPRHYPAVDPERLALTEALYRLANDPAERQRYLAEPRVYAASLGLSQAEEEALVSLDEGQMAALGVHPLVPFLARLQLDRQGNGNE